MIKNLLFFETNKFIKKKKNIAIFVLMIVFTVAALFINNLMNADIERNKVNSYNYEIQSVNDSIYSLPAIEAAEKVKKEQLKKAELLQLKLEAYKKNDWRKELELQIELDEMLLDGIHSGKVVTGTPTEEIEERIAINDQLLKRNIRPVNEPYATNGVYFLRVLFTSFLSIVGVIFFIFLIGDILSNELEKGTIKLLFTQPISRQSILNSKYFVAIASSIFILLFITGFALLLSSLIFGMGSLHYPIPIHTETVITFIDLSSLLVQSLLLFILVIAFVTSVSQLLSIVTNSSMLSTGLTIIITLVVSMVIPQFEFLFSIAHLIPFCYIDTVNVIDGTLATKLTNSHFTFMNGILVLLFFTIINYSIVSYLFRKKEILS